MSFVSDKDFLAYFKALTYGGMVAWSITMVLYYLTKNTFLANLVGVLAGLPIGIYVYNKEMGFNGNRRTH